MESINKSKIAQAIEKETKPDRFIVFHPTPEFYKNVNIGRKRWWQLYRGEKRALEDELERIASFFKIDITELLSKK